MVTGAWAVNPQSPQVSTHTPDGKTYTGSIRDRHRMYGIEPTREEYAEYVAWLVQFKMGTGRATKVLQDSQDRFIEKFAYLLDQVNPN